MFNENKIHFKKVNKKNNNKYKIKLKRLLKKIKS